METSIYERLSQVLTSLEILATFPNRDSTRLKFLDNRFVNVCEFFTLYMKSIEPFWSLVEKYISQNRPEVYRKIQALSHIHKAPLTFKEAFRYMISWNIRRYERFFLNVGLPSNIAHRLGGCLEEGNYDEVCEVLESFNSSEFLSNIGMMCLLEYGNLDVLYECRPTHLLDVKMYRDFFVVKQRTDQNATNVFNSVMSVICEELGIRDIRLVIHKLTSLGYRRIRIRRGCEVIVVDWPLAKVGSFDINRFFSEDSLATLENRIMSQLEVRGHSVSFDYLKKDALDYLYEILFASINRNFMDIFKVFKVDNGVIISKYKEKLESRSDGYFALTDFNPLEGLLVEYFLQIKESQPILKEVLPKDVFAELEEKSGFRVRSMLDSEKIGSDSSQTIEQVRAYDNNNNGKSRLEIPSRLVNNTERLGSECFEQILKGIFDIYGKHFENMSLEEFLYLFGVIHKMPRGYKTPYYWAGEESTMKAIIRVLYMPQPKILGRLILHSSDKCAGVETHNWAKNKDKVAYRDVEINITKIVRQVTGKNLDQL